MSKEIKENEKIWKSLDIDVKEVDDKSRTITALISKEVVDRDGDIIIQSGINTKFWKQNPIILADHRYGIETLIGKGVGKKIWTEGKDTWIKFQLATEDEQPLAERAFRLYKGGYLKTMSIGFIPNFEKIEYPNKKRKDGATRIFQEIEMLEGSVTPIPANRAAFMKGINKAWDDNVIDGIELNEWEEMAEELESKTTEIDVEVIEKEVEVEEIDTKTIEKTIEEAVSTIEELTESLEDSNSKIQEQENKILELELLVKEQEIEEEINEENSYLTELFEEFTPAGSDGPSANAEHMEENSIDEILNNLEGENDNED